MGKEVEYTFRDGEDGTENTNPKLINLRLKEIRNEKFFFWAEDQANRMYFLKQDNGGNIEAQLNDIYSPFLVRIIGKRSIEKKTCLTDIAESGDDGSKTNVYEPKNNTQENIITVLVMERMDSSLSDFIAKRDTGKKFQQKLLKGKALPKINKVHDGNPSKKSPLNEEEIARIFLCLLFGMKDLAKMRITHKDIKPGNILINEGVGGYIGSVKIVDYNISARAYENNAKREGTLGWSHPEAFNAVSPDAGFFDIYSAGLVLYCLYENQMLFSNDKPSEEPYLLPENMEGDIPAEILEIIKRCIASPERQQSVGVGFDRDEARNDPSKLVEKIMNDYCGYLEKHKITPQMPELLFFNKTNKTSLQYKIVTYPARKLRNVYCKIAEYGVHYPTYDAPKGSKIYGVAEHRRTFKDDFLVFYRYGGFDRYAVLKPGVVKLNNGEESGELSIGSSFFICETNTTGASSQPVGTEYIIERLGE